MADGVLLMLDARLELLAIGRELVGRGIVLASSWSAPRRACARPKLRGSDMDLLAADRCGGGRALRR